MLERTVPMRVLYHLLCKLRDTLLMPLELHPERLLLTHYTHFVLVALIVIITVLTISRLLSLDPGVLLCPFGLFLGPAVLPVSVDYIGVEYDLLEDVQVVFLLVLDLEHKFE